MRAGYPPTPPKDSTPEDPSRPPEDGSTYVQPAVGLPAEPEAASALMSSDMKPAPDSLMTFSASFPYSSRKLQEGTQMYPPPSGPPDQNSPPTSSSSASYSYYGAAPNDLSSPLYSSYPTAGVFSAKTLQPSRPRTKTRSNAGKVTEAPGWWPVCDSISTFNASSCPPHSRPHCTAAALLTRVG